MFVFGMEEWQRILEKLKELPLSSARHLQRFLASGAAEVELDKQGRILLPPVLREYAALEKDIIVAGVISRAEIWSKSAWEQGPLQTSPDLIAEEMEKLGF